MEERVKEFAAKLTLVPIPPPGQLHLVCICVCVCKVQLRNCYLDPVTRAITQCCLCSAFQMFTLRPLTIILPSREDKDHTALDLDLHLPLLCFRPQQLLQVLQRHFVFTLRLEKVYIKCLVSSSLRPPSLQVLSCLLQEQQVVLFSADWARLTLVAESLLIFLQVRSRSVNANYNINKWLNYCFVTFSF